VTQGNCHGRRYPHKGQRTESLNVSRQEREVGVFGEIVGRTVCGSVVQCLATLGSEDAVNDRAKRCSVCIVGGQANDGSWQEAGEGGVVNVPIWRD
jgi:hypothetical protein